MLSAHLGKTWSPRIGVCRISALRPATHLIWRVSANWPCVGHSPRSLCCRTAPARAPANLRPRIDGFKVQQICTSHTGDGTSKHRLDAVALADLPANIAGDALIRRAP